MATTPYFLAALEARQERYVLGVGADFRVSHQRQATSPAPRVDRLLQALPRWPWRTIRWRQGSQGWLRKKFVAVCCWRVTREGQRHVGWLLGERATCGQRGERKSSWSHLSAAATMEAWAGDAHRRYAIEPFHAEATGEVGWDQYQGRQWPGFHRHAVTVMLAHNFVVWLAWRQRLRPRGRGRPRAPCFPSPRPTAAQPAGRPSRGGPVAPPPSRPVMDHDGSVH